MTSDRTILITGVTGNQRGAVAQALQGTGLHLCGLTRKPDSKRAAALARHNVDLVKGDLDDETTLRRALAGAWCVFSVQNSLEAGVSLKTRKVVTRRNLEDPCSSRLMEAPCRKK